MAQLAQAIRNSKVKLRDAAKEAKLTRNRVQADQLRAGRAYLARMLRKAPDPREIETLLEAVKARWEPPDAEKGEGPGKGSEWRNPEDRNSKKQLLREVVLTSKNMHQLAKQFLKTAEECEEIRAFMIQPARGIVRAPVPTAQFTPGQVADMLGLFLVVIALVERYAKGLKGAAPVAPRSKSS